MLFSLGFTARGAETSLVLLKVNGFFYFLGKFKLGRVRLVRMGGLEVIEKGVWARVSCIMFVREGFFGLGLAVVLFIYIGVKWFRRVYLVFEGCF